MKRFCVTFRRTVTQYAVVELDAETDKQAVKLARRQVRDGEDELDWMGTYYRKPAVEQVEETGPAEPVEEPPPRRRKKGRRPHEGTAA